MKQLFATFYQLRERVSLDFVRYLYHEIRWNGEDNPHASIYKRALPWL